MDSTDRLIGTLIERTEGMGRELHAMNLKLDALSAHSESRIIQIENRIKTLELRWAEKTGSNRMAAIVFGAAATIGGLVAAALGSLMKLWN